MLQLLRTKLAPSDFLHSFAQKDASGHIFCFLYFDANLEFKMKIVILNYMQQLILRK